MNYEHTIYAAGAPQRSYSIGVSGSGPHTPSADVRPLVDGFWMTVIVWSAVCLWAQWVMVRDGKLRKVERDVGY